MVDSPTLAVLRSAPAAPRQGGHEGGRSQDTLGDVFKYGPSCRPPRDVLGLFLRARALAASIPSRVLTYRNYRRVCLRFVASRRFIGVGLCRCALIMYLPYLFFHHDRCECASPAVVPFISALIHGEVLECGGSGFEACFPIRTVWQGCGDHSSSSYGCFSPLLIMQGTY